MIKYPSLGKVLDQAAARLDASAGALFVRQAGGEELICAATWGISQDAPALALCFGEELAGKTAQDGQARLVDNCQGLMEAEALHAAIAAPLLWEGQVTGVICLARRQPERPFCQGDLDLLNLFADHATTILENARLLESEQQRRQDAESLAQAIAALAASLDLRQVLETILSRLESVVPYDSASIFLLQQGSLQGVACRGFAHPELVVGQQFPADDPIFLSASQQQKPLLLADASQEPRFHGWGGTEYTRGWLGVPLISRHKVIGYLTCDSHQPAHFTTTHAALAEAFSSQAVAAIENAALFQAERQAR